MRNAIDQNINKVGNQKYDAIINILLIFQKHFSKSFFFPTFASAKAITKQM